MGLRTAAATLLFVLVGAATHSQVPTRSEIYRYSAVNRDLRDVLRGFAADQRLNAVIDPTIPSQAISESVELPPEEFLEYITGKYGLIWYYDGASLYIYPGGALATKAFRLRYTTPSLVIETMRHFNSYSERYPFRTLEKESVILAVAPPRMLEMTALVVGTLESSAQVVASTELSIAVFPLKYASAADQSIQFNGSSTNIPGVATLLQSLVTGNSVSGKVSTYLPRNLPGLEGSGLNRFAKSDEGYFNPGADAANDAPPPASPPPPTQGANAAQTIRPTISADTRTNSVIIRDLPSRMAAYEQVIHSLDQPTGLIEITARIIDITKEGVFEWGLPYDFQLGSADSSKQLSIELTPTDTPNLAVTLLDDDVTKFLGQIKALEQEGYARVASRPSLLTQDNVEAQIDNSETFYVRVEGDFEVDLFDVSIGTTLNILPHVINQNGKRMIKLAVQITDGAVLEQTVDEIPRVRSDSITTQAVLGENESLLIGGLFREEKSQSQSRIPILGSLPGVGRLFRSEEYNTSRVERLILIEPRIVAMPTVVNGGLQLLPLSGAGAVEGGAATAQCGEVFEGPPSPWANPAEILTPPTEEIPPSPVPPKRAPLKDLLRRDAPDAVPSEKTNQLTSTASEEKRTWWKWTPWKTTKALAERTPAEKTIVRKAPGPASRLTGTEADTQETSIRTARSLRRLPTF